MSWPDITRIVIIVIVAFLVIYDVFVYRIAGSEATISRVSLSWVTTYPLLILIVGYLLGHMINYQEPNTVPTDLKIPKASND